MVYQFGAIINLGNAMGNLAALGGDGWRAVFMAVGFIAALKLLGLATVIYATNAGTPKRFKFMWGGGERLGFLQLLVEWIVVLTALSVVLFHPGAIF
jgi:uncharacterized membrane protein